MAKKEDTNNPQASNVQITVDPTRTPILYADLVYIKSTENGIVLDVAQQLGPSAQYTIVARVGFSRDHVAKLIENLEALLRVEGTSMTKKKD